MRRIKDSWYSDFWYDGVRYKKSWGNISKTVAKENDKKFYTEVREGKHQQKTKKIFFENFAEKYLDYVKVNKKSNTYKSYTSKINMLMPFFKGMLLQDIHPFIVEKYRKERREAKIEPATINRDTATLTNMFKKAVEWKYLQSNPLPTVKKLTEKDGKMWVLTPEEEQRLLEECDKRPQIKKYLRDLVLLALNTGMREAEIFNLQKCNVDLNNTHSILVTDTKNNENRRVPINETAREILKRRLKDDASDYVFYQSRSEKDGNEKPAKLKVLTNAFWEAVRKAGLERKEIIKDEEKKIRFRFHDCRHTFGSRLGMAGVDLKTIMEIMGHRSAKVAMRYQHPTPEHKMNAVKNLENYGLKHGQGQILELKK